MSDFILTPEQEGELVQHIQSYMDSDIIPDNVVVRYVPGILVGGYHRHEWFIGEDVVDIDVKFLVGKNKSEMIIVTREGGNIVSMSSGLKEFEAFRDHFEEEGISRYNIWWAGEYKDLAFEEAYDLYMEGIDHRLDSIRGVFSFLRRRRRI